MINFSSDPLAANLAMAIVKGNVESVEKLVQSPIDLDSTGVFDVDTSIGDTFLTLATRWNQEKIVEILLNSNVDRTLTNITGETALGLAQNLHHDKIAQMLREPNRQQALLTHSKALGIMTTKDTKSRCSELPHDISLHIILPMIQIEAIIKAVESLVERKQLSEADGNKLLSTAKETSLFKQAQQLLQKINFIRDSEERDIPYNVPLTLLSFAAGLGNIEACRWLLQAGADINGRGSLKDRSDLNFNRFQSPLEAAIRGNQYAMVNFLLAEGADVEIDSVKTLRWLKYDKEFDFRITQLIVRELQKRNLLNRPIIKSGMTFLMAASGHHCLDDAHNFACLETVKLMVRYGADINAKDKYGRTALSYQILNNNLHEEQLDPERMRFLCDKGADVNVVDNEGRTPLLQLADDFANIVDNSKHAYYAPYYLKLFMVLIEFSANVNATDNKGQTPLHYLMAANPSGYFDKGVDELIQFLISSGAEINKADNEGLTPLHHLVRDITFSTDLERDSKQFYDSVKFLKLNGANINAVDKKGRTPLHLFISELEIMNDFNNPCPSNYCKWLVELGADVNAKDNDGKTPFDYLSEKRKINETYATCLSVASLQEENEAIFSAATTEQREGQPCPPSPLNYDWKE